MGWTVYLDPLYPTMLTELGTTQGTLTFRLKHLLFFYILLLRLARLLKDHWHGLYDAETWHHAVERLDEKSRNSSDVRTSTWITGMAIDMTTETDRVRPTLYETIGCYPERYRWLQDEFEILLDISYYATNVVDKLRPAGNTRILNRRAARPVILHRRNVWHCGAEPQKDS
jgi:hypothetical protein